MDRLIEKYQKKPTHQGFQKAAQPAGKISILPA